MTRQLVDLPTFQTRAPRGSVLLASAVLAVWRQVAQLFARKR